MPVSNQYFQHDTQLVPGTKARAEDMNSRFNALVVGLDKLPDPASGSPGFSEPITVVDAVALGQAVSAGQAMAGGLSYAEDTGAANAYVVDLAIAPAAYTDGLTVSFKAANANTGPSTLNVNSLGVKTFVRSTGIALVSGDIVAGQIVTVIFDFTGNKFKGITSFQGQVDISEANAAASAATATTQAGIATTQAGIATTQAGISTTKASEAAESVASINNIEATTHAATSKATPVDADEIPMSDSAASWGLKKLTWVNIKATLKSYFDTLYTAAPITDNITVTVGSGGQFSTINAALAYLTARYPIYKSGGGITATVQLLTGFVMAEQVIVSGIDLGWVTITSVDATVSITRSALTIATSDLSCPAFSVLKGGTLPIIGALFSMDTSGSSANRIGVLAYGAGSSATILSGKGVTNSGDHGILAGSCADVSASGANFSNAGGSGVVALHGATINAVSANASGASVYGVVAEYGSTINASYANAQIGGSPSTSDFICLYGSIINKIGGTGGVSKTVNTLTSDGIIYG